MFSVVGHNVGTVEFTQQIITSTGRETVKVMQLNGALITSHLYSLHLGLYAFVPQSKKRSLCALSDAMRRT